MSDFVYTTAIKKLRTLKKRIRKVPGGTSAGKTFGILPIEIDYAIKNPLTETSIVSESVPHLRRGALKDFQKIMWDTGRWVQSNYNKSLLKYTFSNGSYIEFFSTDQPDRLRGARRHRLYVNECNNITWEAYMQLAIRTRDVVWLDYNPTHEFWADTELDDEDVDLLRLTYKDNEALSPSIIKEIEKAKERAKTSTYWDNWWKVYGLGELGSLEGVVFNNWQIVDRIPKEAKYIGSGMDFGYSNDPTTLIDVYQYNNQWIFDEVIYRKGLLNSEIAALIKRDGKNRLIYADSAEPKSIAELRRYGISILPAQKGKDSILYGIDLLQQQNFKVTKNSTNLIKELRGYVWDTDKTGKKLNKPVDFLNHAIDSIRYFAIMKLKKNIGSYDIR
ncbi:PBSX family phage terminase large subunit [Flagellimonas sp. CMM7]|uniref:PBSX family phage terminase large subunit n=1 Tax=Flagellimonas sp. CMM7 TaxID=2654676 RepID=UPI0013D6A29C|nr:terminase large subunit [Flagellimonas sp. CMM7]UII80011.1 terminase large subunit [Flagellimonas sp. CMM7]